MSIDATRATWKLGKQVTAIQKLLLLSLADRAGESGQCWPSLKRLEADTNLNRKTIIENRQTLIALGLLEYTGHYQGKQKQIPVMRLTYVNNREDEEHSDKDFTGTENGTGSNFTSTENNTGTSTENGTGNQYRKRDTEPKRLEPKRRTVKEKLKQKEMEDKMIDPNYEYPETYFPITTEKQSVGKQLVVNQTKSLFNASDAHQTKFEEFWSYYPIKKQKQRVEVVWYTQECHLNANEIINKLKQQVDKDRDFLRGFAPNPIKYLQDERWKDEVYEVKKKTCYDHKDKTWALKPKNEDDLFGYFQ